MICLLIDQSKKERKARINKMPGKVKYKDTTDTPILHTTKEVVFKVNTVADILIFQCILHIHSTCFMLYCVHLPEGRVR